MDIHPRSVGEPRTFVILDVNGTVVASYGRSNNTTQARRKIQDTFAPQAMQIYQETVFECLESATGVSEVHRVPLRNGDTIDIMMAWLEKKNLLLGMSFETTSGPKEFSPRQKQIYELMQQDKTVEEIAAIMGVTPSTILTQQQTMREKVGVKTNWGLMERCGVTGESMVLRL